MKNTMTSKIELPVQAEEGFETKAWVVFTGQTDRPWLRFLRPGFRHCFVLLNDGRQWMSFDPMLNHIEVKIQHSVNADFDLPNWLAGHSCAMAFLHLCGGDQACTGLARPHDLYAMAALQTSDKF